MLPARWVVVTVLVLALLCSACSVIGRDTGGAPDDGAAAAPADPAAVDRESDAPAAGPPPVMVVLDASGSMTRDDVSPDRFRAATDAVRTLADVLPDGRDAGLTVYGTGTGNSDAERRAGCRDVQVTLPVAPVDRGEWDRTLDRLVPRGYTPIAAAVREAAAAMPGTGPREVVLVSDGIDTCSPPPPCDAVRDLRLDDPQLVVHTLGFRTDSAAQEQLSCIARAGGGTYLEAVDAGLLRTRLAALVSDSSDVLLPTGYRGLELGMESREAAVVAADAGTPLDQVDDRGTSTVTWLDCRLTFVDGQLASIAIARDDVSTVDGVAVGDTLAEVRSALGTLRDLDPTHVFVPADELAGTGYQLAHDGSAVTGVMLCRCTLAGSGSGRVALGAVFASSEGTVIWNGTEAVRYVPSDANPDVRPFGFVGDRVVYGAGGGAHGHVWELQSVDVTDGSVRASARCDTCDTGSVVGGSQVLTVDGYDRRLTWWDADLEPVRSVDVPTTAVRDVVTPEFGDGLPALGLLTAVPGATYLQAALPTDADDVPTSRVVRVSDDGEVTAASEVLGTTTYLRGASLGPDGARLFAALSTGEVVVLDATSLEIVRRIPAPEVGVQYWGAQPPVVDADENVQLRAERCSRQDSCYDEGRVRATWDGSSWAVVNDPAVCHGRLGSTRLRVVSRDDPSATYGVTSTLQRAIGNGPWQDLVSSPSSGCAVDAPDDITP